MPTADRVNSPFPPVRHVYRDLGIESVLSDGAARGSILPGPWTEGPAPSWVGPLLTALDVLAGAVVGRLVAPDWMATSSLELHLLDDVATGAPAASPGSPVELDVTVARDGRSTVVVDLQAARDDVLVAVGTATFIRLPRRDGNLPVFALRSESGQQVVLDGGDQTAAGPFDELLSPPPPVPPALAVRDYVRNSVGSVNGGVLAAFAELAARRAGPPGSWSTDIVAHFLRAARTGTVVARTEARVRDRDGLVVVHLGEAANPAASVLRATVRIVAGER
jgi:acyl-coenzyme A thioesterase PaaI-like protein